MANYTVHPIPLAETILDKSALTYRRSFGEKYTQLSYIWYLEGPDHKIIVDAGVDSEYLAKVRGIPSKDIQSVSEGLGKFGLSPEDIDLVIVTHLHSDHVAQARQFTKARLLVQQAELEFANNPHPTVAPQYPSHFFSDLKFETLSGDTQICDGVSVIDTPGHTVGGQSVVVNTNRGTAVISGLCTIQENFEPPESVRKTMEVIPCGVFVDLFDTYDSLLRIKQTADIVISLHDPKFRGLGAIG
jgi:N-acyl homoserine lactone hydrolase